jgi:hypothetical protein
MLLTKHRTLSGSCLVSAWLNSGEKLPADCKQQDGDGQLTQSEESARNLTEEVSFCMEFELSGVLLLLAVIPLRFYQPLYFSLLDSSIQVKATVRQQGFADFKGETIIPLPFIQLPKKVNRKAFFQFIVEFFTRGFAEEGDLAEASVTAAAKLLPQACLRARQSRDHNTV